MSGKGAMVTQDNFGTTVGICRDFAPTRVLSPATRQVVTKPLMPFTIKSFDKARAGSR